MEEFCKFHFGLEHSNRFVQGSFSSKSQVQIVAPIRLNHIMRNLCPNSWPGPWLCLTSQIFWSNDFQYRSVHQQSGQTLEPKIISITDPLSTLTILSSRSAIYSLLAKIWGLFMAAMHFFPDLLNHSFLSSEARYFSNSTSSWLPALKRKHWSVYCQIFHHNLYLARSHWAIRNRQTTLFLPRKYSRIWEL
jgi:hypothetical protein